MRACPLLSLYMNMPLGSHKKLLLRARLLHRNPRIDLFQCKYNLYPLENLPPFLSDPSYNLSTLKPEPQIQASGDPPDEISSRPASTGGKRNAYLFAQQCAPLLTRKARLAGQLFRTRLPRILRPSKGHRRGLHSY